MKIAFIFHDAEVYGAPKSLLDLIDGLLEKDNHVTCYAILPYRGPLVHEIEKRNLTYRIIGYPRWVHKNLSTLPFHWRTVIAKIRDNRFTRLTKTVQGALQISKELKAWKIDTVYSNTSVVAAGALAAILTGKKHIWHIREFQKLDQGLTLDWGKKFFKAVVNRSDAVVFISRAVKDYYNHTFKITNGIVIYNGVVSLYDFDKIQKRKLLHQKKSPFIFCIIGRLTPQKGQLEAIKAISLLKQAGLNVQLLIVGKGNDKELRKMSENLDLTNQVIFCGHVTDPYSIYLESDACLMCSWHEAFGRVTIEAMAAALPIIGKKTAFSGTVELIQDGITGLLYEGDERSLSEKMKELISNPEKGKQLGEKAWQYAKEHFNREQYVSQIYNLLTSI